MCIRDRRLVLLFVPFDVWIADRGHDLFLGSEVIDGVVEEFGQRDIDSAAPLPREQRVVKGIYEVEQPEMVAVDNLDADGVLWLPGHQRHGVS